MTPAALEAEPLSTEQDDASELAALRRGSEAAFLELVKRYHSALIRLAQAHIGDRGIAEELAQETWLVVLRNLERFKGHSSLKTWIFAILLNCARNRARKEQHTIPFSVAQTARPAVSSEHFRDADDDWPGAWAHVPSAWSDTPEDRLLSREVGERIQAEIDRLPPHQRQVLLLRDVHGCTAGEVADVLRVSQTNQRVLLHRGRSRVRQALEDYFTEK